MNATMTEAPTSQPATAEPTLTALDRCDRCGAQAYVRTGHISGDLLFCAHHFNRHRDVLAPFVVLNEIARLHEANHAFKTGE